MSPAILEGEGDGNCHSKGNNWIWVKILPLLLIGYEEDVGTAVNKQWVLWFKIMINTFSP